MLSGGFEWRKTAATLIPRTQVTTARCLTSTCVMTTLPFIGGSDCCEGGAAAAIALVGASTRSAMKRLFPLSRLVGLAAASLALAACSELGVPGAANAPAVNGTAAAQTARPSAAAQPTAPQPAAPPPADLAVRNTFVAPPPLRFPDAVARAGAQLIRVALLEIGGERRSLVIDPLIDANTGGQTADTVRMGSQLEATIKSQAAGWSVKPLTREALAAGPLLLIGTLTPINSEPAIDKKPDAYRIWLTLIDTRTKRVVAKQLDRATIDSTNPEPLPFYRDSPTWHRDRTVASYINSCQINTKIGDLADPDYVSRWPAVATINEAIMAYNAGRLDQANKLYGQAAELADPGDLRVLNGLYLTSWKLGRREQAKDAFSKLVASGLELKRLPVKMVFETGQTTFMKLPGLAEQYEIWLDELAEGAGRVRSCIRVVGHSSRTGPASVNLPLSRRRAEAVLEALRKRNPSLATRLSATGVGSAEALSGLGTDDARDALDRRVEFKVVDCL